MYSKKCERIKQKYCEANFLQNPAAEHLLLFPDTSGRSQPPKRNAAAPFAEPCAQFTHGNLTVHAAGGADTCVEETPGGETC